MSLVTIVFLSPILPSSTLSVGAGSSKQCGVRGLGAMGIRELARAVGLCGKTPTPDDPLAPKKSPHFSAQGPKSVNFSCSMAGAPSHLGAIRLQGRKLGETYMDGTLATRPSCSKGYPRSVH